MTETQIGEGLCQYFWVNLGNWFAVCKRDLPWRHNPSPYEVWVSELMLQQTQVVTVLPYYRRWMAQFPDLKTLASSSLDDVLEVWAGLGYYRRARYLYAGAQYIMSHCNGEFPSTIEKLRKIPGVGDYTSGAIASFAFGQDVPAIDGNAERVFSRFFGIVGDIARGTSRKRLVDVATCVAKLGNAANLNQAVMDLGASLCGRVPQCELCPLASRCYARIFNKQQSLPQKKQPSKKSGEYYVALILTDGESCLIARRASGELLGGLWQFPMFLVARTSANEIRLQARELNSVDAAAYWRPLAAAIDRPSLISDITIDASFGKIEHIFSHIHMVVTLDRAYIGHDICEKMHFRQEAIIPLSSQDLPYDAYAWANCEKIAKNYAISSLMKKLLNAAMHDL